MLKWTILAAWRRRTGQLLAVLTATLAAAGAASAGNPPIVLAGQHPNSVSGTRPVCHFPKGTDRAFYIVNGCKPPAAKKATVTASHK